MIRYALLIETKIIIRFGGLFRHLHVQNLSSHGGNMKRFIAIILFISVFSIGYGFAAKANANPKNFTKCARSSVNSVIHPAKTRRSTKPIEL